MADFIGNVNLFDGTLVDDAARPLRRSIAGEGAFMSGTASPASRACAMSVARCDPRRSNLSERRAGLSYPPHNRMTRRGGASAPISAATSLYRIELGRLARSLQVSVPNSERHSEAIKTGAEVYAASSGRTGRAGQLRPT